MPVEAHLIPMALDGLGRKVNARAVLSMDGARDAKRSIRILGCAMCSRCTREGGKNGKLSGVS